MKERMKTLHRHGIGQSRDRDGAVAIRKRTASYIRAFYDRLCSPADDPNEGERLQVPTALRSRLRTRRYFHS